MACTIPSSSVDSGSVSLFFDAQAANQFVQADLLVRYLPLSFSDNVLSGFDKIEQCFTKEIRQKYPLAVTAFLTEVQKELSIKRNALNEYDKAINEIMEEQSRALLLAEVYSLYDEAEARLGQQKICPTSESTPLHLVPVDFLLHFLGSKSSSEAKSWLEEMITINTERKRRVDTLSYEQKKDVLSRYPQSEESSLEWRKFLLTSEEFAFYDLESGSLTKEQDISDSLLALAGRFHEKDLTPITFSKYSSSQPHI